MADRRISTAIALAASFALAAACNREPQQDAESRVVTSGDSSAELQQERQEHIAELERRVAELERDYADENQEVVSGARTAAAGLREELKEDVANVRQAVSDLQSTTPENWWSRHEQAMRRSAQDVEEDVRRIAGNLPPAPAPTGTAGDNAETVSTAPFTSRRDTFVADLRRRVEAMERALDGVKAGGTKETELEDTRARVRKLNEDLDQLGKASAEDWWDLSRERVAEYVARVEDSVGRLDDNKPANR